ncbi:conserved hypothetical protein [Vibrio chagasii]|nr:conserved hypothetical protein [Vibrio chagasii]
MGLNLTHTKIKALLDGVTTISCYPVFVPVTATYPAIAYYMTGLARDIQSNLNETTISLSSYTILIASKSFSESQDLAQDIVNKLDQYADEDFLLILVEDAADEYDPEQGLFIKSLQITTRFKE